MTPAVFRWPCAALLVLTCATNVFAQAPLEVPAFLASVDRAFPLIEAARREQDLAAGAATEARGAFDLKLKAEAETLRSYYDNDRLKATVEQPLAPLVVVALRTQRAHIERR